MYMYIFILLFAITPAFGQYRVVHGHNQQIIQIPQRTVQFDARYFLGERGYYAVGDRIAAEKDSAKEDEIKAVKAKLDALLDLLARERAAKGGGIPIPDPSKPPVPEEPTIPAEQEDSYDAQALKIFNAKCVKCHGTSKADAGFVIVKDGKLLHNAETLEDYRTRTKIFDLVYGANLKERGLSQMPKGSTLTDEEVEYIRLWVVDRVHK